VLAGLCLEYVWINILNDLPNDQTSH
jgi:hypothetical protein